MMMMMMMMMMMNDELLLMMEVESDQTVDAQICDHMMMMMISHVREAIY